MSVSKQSKTMKQSKQSPQPKTQVAMGRGSLLKRLTAQTGSAAMATGILKKRGDMNADGSLTAHGAARNLMTAEERALDRSAKRYGKPTTSFEYNPRTNSANLKG